MCGIAGLVADGPGLDLGLIDAMTASLRHRGPDDDGFFRAPDHGIALGQRRLSIIDLAGGRQPIFNEDESVVVVFNGEIYNYVELRAELEARGHRFATHSDTVVIVHLNEDLGDDFPTRLNGDFAIALYDRQRRRLVLARDRLGIRPLVWAETSRGFAFGSEPKAVLASGLVERSLDRDALASWIRLRYTPGPRTLFAGISKLPPGFLGVREDGKRLELKAYWDIDGIEPRERPDREVEDELDELLSDAVRIRLRSDVPVAAFLSGGLDSSLIVKLAADHGNVHRAYSVGFNLAIDENAAARAFAAERGIPHEDIYVARDAWKDLPRIVGRMDDPIGDVIILPTHRLAEEASRSVKVVLTGEGADEIWGGYLHHYALHYLVGAARRSPGAVRVAETLARLAPVGLLSALFPYPAALGRKGKEKLVSALAAAQRPRDAYQLFATFLAADGASRLLGTPGAVQLPPTFDALADSSRSMLRRILAVERRAWLPDYTLAKQDTLSMANSLEARVPFLDHRIVELAAGLPDHQKVRMGRAKHLLRRVAARHIDPAVAWRKKKAFYIPTEQSFDEGFLAFRNELFDPARIRRQGLFDPEAFSSLTNTTSGEILDHKLQNTLLILQVWLG